MSTAYTPSAAAPAADEQATPTRSLAVGDVLRGRYRIQGLLGRGGMGTVFAATDRYRLDGSHGDQRVAIKVLHTEVMKRPRLFAELRREFQHLQTLSHPNIVRVHEFDRDGDLAFFSMECLSGEMLSRVLAVADASAMHRPYALAIIRDVGAAIAHAHARGVVHGDLNPGNIFVTDEGEIRVLDFGASHRLHSAPSISEYDQHHQLAVAPSYASCQVLEGEAADARDDVYALACIAYKLLTGNHPYRDDTALKARSRRLSPARPGGLTRRQWHTLRQGLHFDRGRRPADVRSWLDRLELRSAAERLPEIRSLWLPRPRRRHPLEWSAAGVATALILGGAWFALTHHDEVDRGAAALGDQIKSLLRPAPIRSTGDAAIAAPAAADPPAATTDAQAAAPPDSRPAPGAEVSVAPATAPVTAATVAPAAAPDHAPARLAATATAPGSTPAPAVADFAPGGTAPRARIELAADSVDVPPTEDTAHIVVRRDRALRDDVSFMWWTESGTAKPGVDFVPVKSTVEHIEIGKNSVSLAVPLITDPARHASRSFYVVIDDASDNAALGPRTLTMVTLPGSD
jgi:serine/threonine protein kinase